MPAETRLELLRPNGGSRTSSANAVDRTATAREGQITDRYTKAVEQLASSTTDVRLGAIYALQRIAADSSKDRLTIRSVLAAYVRNHDFCAPQPPAAQCGATLSRLVLTRTVKRLPPDVQAALTIASGLTVPGGQLTDFSETRFPRAQLTRAQLSRASLERADLTWIGLWEADLSQANASGACLTYANLTEANLSAANLAGADLYRAQLSGANLSGTDLRGADLRDVFGMTPDQIRAVAVTNAETKFGKTWTAGRPAARSTHTPIDRSIPSRAAGRATPALD